MSSSTERPAPETDSQKAAQGMADEIMSGKVSKRDLPTVQRAIDIVTAAPEGRAKSNEALGRITRGS